MYRQLSEEEKKEYKKQQERIKKDIKTCQIRKNKAGSMNVFQALRKSFCKQISYLKAFPKNPVTGIAEQEHQLIFTGHRP